MLKISLQKDLTFKLYYKLTSADDTKAIKMNNKFSFIFVNGTYSSSKSKFAENLASYSYNFGYKIHIFKKGFSELPSLSTKKFVGDMLNFIDQKSIKKGEKIIVIIPPIINTKLIIDNLLKIPEFVENCAVQAIVTKINLNNFYQNSNKEICENFLSFCTSGYSQFIILDHHEKQDSEINSIYSFLEELFPYGIIFRTSNNIVHESIAKDILNYDAFDSKINKLERRKTIPFKSKRL